MKFLPLTPYQALKESRNGTPLYFGDGYHPETAKLGDLLHVDACDAVPFLAAVSGSDDWFCCCYMKA